MSKDKDVRDLKDALSLRDKSLGGKARRFVMPEEKVLEKAQEVAKRKGHGAAVSFLSRRTGQPPSVCEQILKNDKALEEAVEEGGEALEDLVIEEAFQQGLGIDTMVLLTLERMKKKGSRTSDHELSDVDLESAASDLAEVMEYLCMGDISPLRLLRVTLQKLDLLHSGSLEDLREFHEAIGEVRKFPLSRDIRRVFPT